ncbi:MAG: hypothetical protein KC619_22040 [Myxococcales bacterium]|nr:hypothetical protein [Myxococcales bacterium]
MRRLGVALALLALACEPPVTPLRPDAAAPDAGFDPTGFHDPLSRPMAPTLSPGDFSSAADCGGCHVTHAEEWRTSMHAYAMVDPVFRALVAVRQTEYEGTQDQFCLQCHSAIATRGGEIVDGFAFEELSPIALEGVTCEACHRVRELARDYNSGHVLDPGGPLRGSIRDPMVSAAHETTYSPLHEGSAFCGGCHDIRELSGLPLERPYAEWLTSPAREEGRPCQSCHMPTYRGRAADGAPERDLHEHRWVGVDVPLTDGFATPEVIDETRTRVQALLASAAQLDLTVPATMTAGAQLDLEVRVQNLIDGHNLPTGSTFIRQLWLEVVVTDATGAVIYETGTLDENGDLRDPFSEVAPYGDDDLVSFHSSLVDGSGNPEIFPWRAREHFTRSLPPLHDRVVTLFVPTAAETPGPLTVSARLRFRSHPPFLLRALGLPALVDRVEIHDLAAQTAEVALTISGGP